MGKFLGTAGLSRLWKKFRDDIYVLKTDESGAGTYSYTIPSTTTKSVTVDIYTTSTTSSCTLVCTLSQAVEINLLFQLRYTSQNAKRWFTVLAGNTTVQITEPDSALNNTYGRLSNMNEATLVGSTEIQGSGYSFTINTHWNVGSTYLHTISLESAQVDWHKKTVSGTLTRTTTAGTKPALTTKLSVSKTTDGTIEYWDTPSSYSISANATQTTITDAPLSLSETTGSGYLWSVVPFDAAFTTSQSNHFIDCVSRSYTSLDNNITVSMSSWVDTNIQPEIIWYRSSNSSVYVGTLPKVNLSIE